jgi:hypothetical protein
MFVRSPHSQAVPDAHSRRVSVMRTVVVSSVLSLLVCIVVAAVTVVSPDIGMGQDARTPSAALPDTAFGPPAGCPERNWRLGDGRPSDAGGVFRPTEPANHITHPGCTWWDLRCARLAEMAAVCAETLLNAGAERKVLEAYTRPVDPHCLCCGALNP